MAAAGGALLVLTSSGQFSAVPADPTALLFSGNLAGGVCGPKGGGLIRALMAASAVAAPASLSEAHLSGPIRLYADLAAGGFPISTRVAEAQTYFNQGLMLSYGFNHAGAVRSFREAQARDPSCAMCFWGEALALGPNINAAMDDRDRDAALRARDRAVALSSQASPREKRLIEAMALRYSEAADADRAALDAAYADAMLRTARSYRDDNDIAVLAAEAAMDTSPWNYWEADGRTPLGRIGEAVSLIEGVLRREPDHDQAAHLYIHLMEASDPQRAEAAADRLMADGPPSAGHLVHMPAHIYGRRGRYADSIRVNLAAARADEAFIREAGDEGLVRYGYYPHNIHFIVTSAQLAGDMRTALDNAQRLRTVLDPATSARIGWVQLIDAAPYQALAQFAEPRVILAAPEPDPRLPYAAAMRHYARATAYARQRDQRGFDRELAAIDALKSAPGLADMVSQGVPAPDLLDLSQFVARGRLASARGRHGEAADLYRQAAEIEARLSYMEPAFWYYPVHQSLGAALFQSRRYAEAEAAFRTALNQAPNSGWALYGLERSQAALGRRSEAAESGRALDAAWAGDRRWLRMDRL